MLTGGVEVLDGLKVFTVVPGRKYKRILVFYAYALPSSNNTLPSEVLMKTILLAALILISGSAAMASGKIVCSTKVFSFELTPVSQTELNLKITAVKGQASVYMPKVGEVALLTVDLDVSNKTRVILRSEKRQGEVRGYELNMVQDDVLKSTFAANVNVAREGGNSQFLSHSATCERK